MDGPKQMTPEQVEELKEKIKNMSPEELKEFQKKQCIFCQIVEGKVQAKKIYEDNRSIAILDINPANPGHVLLMPKEHYTVMPQLPEDEIAHIFTVAKSLSNTILRALEIKGTNIIVANGPAAGQKAQHFMIHIIPRKENDNITFQLPQNQISEEELERIRSKLAQKLGTKEIVQEQKPVDVSNLISKKEQPVPEQLGKQDLSTKEQVKEEKPANKEQKKDKPVNKDVNLDDIADIFGAK